MRVALCFAVLNLHVAAFGEPVATDPLSRLTSRFDRASATTYWHHRQEPRISPGVGMNACLWQYNDRVDTVLHLHYMGDDWINVEKCIIRVDGAEFEMKPSRSVRRGQSTAKAWEQFGQRLDDDFKGLLTALKGSPKIVSVQLSGRGGAKERVLDTDEMARLADIFAARELLTKNDAHKSASGRLPR